MPIIYRGKRIYDNKWIYGNLITDCQGEMHIVPFGYFYEDGHHLIYDDDTDKPVFFYQDSIELCKDMKGEENNNEKMMVPKTIDC